ncbi:MAG: glycosyltransferase [Desulfobulbus sp.]|nr:glycosyltransferase [Desulfobulbus sp.]
MDNRKKLMHILLTLGSGGLESVVMNMCSRVDNKLFESYVLCLHDCDKKYIDILLKKNVHIDIIKKKYKFDIFFFIRVVRYIKISQIDVIHAHSGCFFYAAIFYLFSGVKKFICTAHGLPVLNRVQDIVEDNISYILCDKFTVVSEEIFNCFTNRFLCSDNKISLIINGVDACFFKPFNMIENYEIRCELNFGRGEFIVGSVGRLAVEKNYSMLIRSFSLFHDKNPSIRKHLIFIGDGPERNALEELCQELGITSMVTFLGNRYDVQKILPIFNVFALSSRTEGTSISLLESQSCGIPAVVTNVGGNGFVVRQGENGILCALDDVEAMATALCRLHDEPETAKNMAQAARRRVLDGLNITSMIEQYQRLYLQHD